MVIYFKKLMKTKRFMEDGENVRHKVDEGRYNDDSKLNWPSYR